MLILVLFTTFSIYLTTGQIISEIETQDIDVGFAPSWSDETQSLYFVDYVDLLGTGARLFRYDFMNRIFYSSIIEGNMSISFIIPVRKRCKNCKNLFIVGLDHDVSIIKWDGISPTARVVENLFSLEQNDPLSRVVLARTDRKGRLYVGTISTEFCDAIGNRSLYRYTPDEGVVQLFYGTFTTSGLAINQQTNKFYHLDSCTIQIVEFDYDPKTGDICNPRIAFDFNSLGKTVGDFVPVGMDIDTNGFLYVSDYSNKEVYVIDPRMSTVLNIINSGELGIAGVAFGGTKRNILFLTDGSLIVRVLSDTFTDTPDTLHQLYAVNGLGATGQKSTYFQLSPKS